MVNETVKPDLVDTKKTEEFTHKYNFEPNREITIVFTDGEFSHCSFNFESHMYSRIDWHVLEAINKKISRIEEMKSIEKSGLSEKGKKL
jgi:hypothetical protein